MERFDEYLELVTTYKDDYLKNNPLIKEYDIDSRDLYCYVSNDVDIILNALNISPSRFGHRYWKDAIYIYILSGRNKLRISRDIYPTIAKKYNSTSVAVERAMRLCLENLMYNVSKSEKNYIGEYLKPSLLFPHSGEILVRLVELVSSKNFQENKHKYFNIEF